MNMCVEIIRFDYLNELCLEDEDLSQHYYSYVWFIN